MDKKLQTKIAILADVFFVMGILTASTVLGAIAQTFPGTSMTGIQMIMTLAMVAAFITMFVGGYLGNIMDKKILAIIGLVIMLIGGLIPTVLNTSLYFIYLSSLCIGAGQGLLKTAITGINTLLLDGQERTKMFGWQTAFQNLGPVVLMLLAGMLAKHYGWTAAYYVFFLYIIAIIITAVMMPKAPPVKVEKQEKISPPFRIYILGFLVAWFAVGYSTFFLNAPIYITVEGLGDPSIIGVVMSVSTLVGFLAGFVFIYFVKVFKHQVITFAAALCAIGYIILAVAPSMATIFLASIISGFAFTQAMAGGLQQVSEIAKAEQVSPSMGTFLSMVSIGAVLSPFILNGITAVIFGQGALLNVFWTAVILLVILAICCAIWGVSMSKHKATVIQAQEV